MMSGPEISSEDASESAMAIMTIPPVARVCLSLNTIFPTSPTPRPSTYIAFAVTWSFTSAESSHISSTSPFSMSKHFFFSTPTDSARIAASLL